MKRRPMRLKAPHSLLPIDLPRHREHRPAELHAPLDDARPVRADDPREGGWGVGPRCVGGGVLEGDFVEAEADLGVGDRGEGVERAKGVDVCGREGWVGLEGLEEDDCACLWMCFVCVLVV